jgi:PAS domain S-box-containing protein
LLLLALLFTYLIFSLRVTLALALVMGIGFTLLSPNLPLAVSPVQFAIEFLLTAGAIFFTVIITRQYDIDERNRAQAALSASEERYRAVVEAQTEMVSRWLPDTTLTFVNEMYCRYTGKAREQLLGTRFSERIRPEDLDVLQKALASMTRENPSVTYERHVVKAGAPERWEQWTDFAIFDESGHISEYQSVGRDITERKQTEIALSKSEARYRAIVEVQTEMICRWLPDNTMTFVNEAYCRFFGMTRDELLSKPALAFVYPDDLPHVHAAIAMISREKPVVTYEHRVYDPAGELRWHHWTDRAIYDGDQIIEYQSVGRDVTDLKQAEDALSASEERYRAIVEAQTEMICRWLPGGKFTFVNEAYHRYFGVTHDELMSNKVLVFTYPDDMDYVKRMMSTITRERPTVSYEQRVITPAGEVLWNQWTDHAIYDGDQIIEYQSVGRDINDLKRAEAAERQQREFAEALASTAALISSTLNLDEVLDRILDQVAGFYPLNSAEVLLIDGDAAYVARTHGYRSPEERNGAISQRFPLSTTTNFRQMMDTGKPVIIPDVRKYPGWVVNEATRWMRSAMGAPIRLEGETIGFLSITSDTAGTFGDQQAVRLQAFADQVAIAIRNARLYDETRRYASELESQVKERTAELQVAHQRLRAILEGTGEGIFYTEAQQFQYVNQAFCKLTGYTEQELIGQSISFLADPNTAEQDIMRLKGIRDTASRGSIWRGETRVRRKDGHYFDAALTVGMLDPSGGSSGAVTVVRDISREKQIHLQRSNLVAYASHELRTPITNMKTRLYLLRRRPEFLEDHLVILDEVTDRMQRLVEDLLDISRLEHGLIPLKRREMRLQDVIDAVVTLQVPEAERKKLDLQCHLPSESIFVSADRERLIQVVTNLVTNALNYTPAGGRVSIGVCQKPNDMACIEVEDTGIGIAPENLPYIFQPFYRVVSEVEGTGLGLSIAKEIIEMHGGALTVRSVPRQGSTFTIMLPLAPPTQQPQGEAAKNA